MIMSVQYTVYWLYVFKNSDIQWLTTLISAIHEFWISIGLSEIISKDKKTDDLKHS